MSKNKDMSPLKALLVEQAKDLEAKGLHTVAPREFLVSVSPMLAENSPSRSRGASASSTRRTQPQVVAVSSTSSTDHSPHKGTLTAAEAAVPVAPDAYMNELPLAPYGSTSHLSLHVTETLELALRVLRKNQQVGRTLSNADQRLLAEIASFAEIIPSPSQAITEQEAIPDHPHGVQDVMIPL